MLGPDPARGPRARFLLGALLSILPLGPGPAGRSEGFGPRLEAIRAEAGVPAMGAAIVTLEGIEGPWVTGRRTEGSSDPVREDDRWHLGSCTKAMTSTLIALLVERGDLAWDAVLGDLLPDLAESMHPDFQGVSLEELLAHRGGVSNAASPALKAGFDAIRERPLVEQRDWVAARCLEQAPAVARGTFLYSNYGYVIAGHVAEVATERSWEDLVTELLFRPLGMESAGFGPPGSPAQLDQPRGHQDDGTPVEPGPEADNPAMIGPAGAVHASLADWGKFVRLHLRGARGPVRVGEITLGAETFARLQRPFGDLPPTYALGWGVESNDWAGGDGTTLAHGGSNTLWHCEVRLGLANGVALLVTANQASPRAKEAVREALRQLGESRRFAEDGEH